MQLDELVGRVAIRFCSTEHGGIVGLYKPVFVAHVRNKYAKVICLEDSNDNSRGDSVSLGKDYFDSEWTDYGDIMTGVATTKATAITQILTVLGIQADEDSLYNLCQALSYKQLLGEIADGMGINELLTLMGTRPQVNNVSAQQVMSSLDKDSAWGGLVPNQNTPIPNSGGGEPSQRPFVGGVRRV